MNLRIGVWRFSSLGDVAMLIPVFLTFRKSYPEIYLDLYTRKEFIPLFKDISGVNCISINPRSNKIRLYDLVQIIPKLLNHNYLKIIDLHSVIRTYFLGFVLAVFGKPILRIDKDRKKKRLLIRDNHSKSIILKHTVDRYAEVFSKAGYPLQDIKEAHLEPIPLDEKEGIYIGIAPFAKFASKQYELKKMAEVMRGIEDPKIHFFIFGKGDQEKRESIENFSSIRNTQILIDKISFEEEIKLISNMDLMISMDSGNGHIASNYGVKVLTLWGTTHPCLGYGPYIQPEGYSIFPDPKQYPYLPVSIYGKLKDNTYLNAINSIEALDVINKIREILQI